jgi:hypothetical protein
MARTGKTGALALLLLTLVAANGAAQEKVTLVYRAKVGQIMRYKHEVSLKAEAGGGKQEFQIKSTEKVTVTAVAASGDITEENLDESSEYTVNGQKVPAPDTPKNTSTVTVHPDGLLVSYKSSDPEADKNKTSVRLYPAENPIFINKPIGVGDKWSHEFKTDTTLGMHAGKADYETLAFEKVNNIDSVKLKISYQETEGAQPLRSTGTLWVEKTTGDVVQSDVNYENIPFGGEDSKASVSGKMHGERTEGNPLEGAKAEDKPKDKTIDEIVKDYEKQPGLFTLYHKREAGRDSIYLEIKESQLDQPLLMEVTASTGTSEQVVAGDPIKDILCKFSRSPDDRILLVTPNTGFRVDEKTPIARAVHRSFADAYLEVYKVEAKQPDRKSLLIDISDLFRGDIAQISSLFRSFGGGLLGALGGGGSYSLDRDKTIITRIKSYPENLSVETSYHFTGSGGGGLLAQLLGGGDVLADSRSIPFKVSYTLFSLSDNGYRPRLYDPRVGYFITEYQSFDNDAVNDPNIRYINRWQLDKADPKAALSDPKKPIVFWLDNAIPTEYRDAVREGILMWNKAFEQIGYKNAIVVKQMPDNADWDHADMRYNTIRWVTSIGAGYAVAQARVNPLTGQVINANITVDSSWTHYIKSERIAVVAPSSYFEQMMAPKDPAQALKNAADPAHCDLAAETGEQAWVGDLAMQMLAPAGTKVDEKAYVHAHLREVVCHEMGHILGLRHNFIASTYHSLAELKNPNVVKNTGVSASVMDYIPFNISALKTADVPFYQDTVGPYDIWAIKYGYLPIDASTPQGEVYKLSQIATQCNEPGHAYESDEVADGFDPAVIRYDLGSDSLAYFERSMDLSRYLLLHLSEREPKQGESYWEFTRDFQRLLGYYTRNATFVSRYIGGLHINRNHKGDANEKPTLMPISAGEQKRALNLLNTYLFAANAFTMPSTYYTHLTSNPGASFIQSILSPKDYPIRDTLSSIQERGLQYVFSPTVLSRISNNEFKVSDTLTLPTLFHSVGDTVWSELETKSNINVLHRQLQRTHLDTMIAMVTNTSNQAPEDARMLAWDQLRRLQTGIRLAQARPHDEYTRIHLDESLMRIQRALNAQQMIGGDNGGGTNALSALLGGDAKSGK